MGCLWNNQRALESNRSGKHATVANERLDRAWQRLNLENKIKSLKKIDQDRTCDHEYKNWPSIERHQCKKCATPIFIRRRMQNGASFWDQSLWANYGNTFKERPWTSSALTVKRNQGGTSAFLQKLTIEPHALCSRSMISSCEERSLVVQYNPPFRYFMVGTCARQQIANRLILHLRKQNERIRSTSRQRPTLLRQYVTGNDVILMSAT